MAKQTIEALMKSKGLECSVKVKKHNFLFLQVAQAKKIYISIK